MEGRAPKPSKPLAVHRGAIYRYILGMVRDPAAAEDLTQETLLRAHRREATLGDPDRLLSWLYRIATNICHDHYRRADQRHRARSLEETRDEDHGEHPALEPADPAPRLDKLMEQQEMSDCVQRYLAGLSDSYRAVILLHDSEGLTNPEIARMLDVSLATVKIRLHRARARLRATLARACSFSTDERGVLTCEPSSDEAGD